MNIQIPTSILKETTSEAFVFSRSLRDVDPNDLETSTDIPLSRIQEAEIQEIRAIAERKEAKKFLRAFDAVLAARNGETEVKVPSFEAFLPILSERMRQRMRDGWIYERCSDGSILPWAIISLRRKAERDAPPLIELTAAAFGPADNFLKVKHKTWTFSAGDVARRNVAEILEKHDLLLETDALRAGYDQAVAVFDEMIQHGFAAQYRVTGPIHFIKPTYGKGLQNVVMGTKVIMDIDPTRIGPYPGEVESKLFGSKSEPLFLGLPRHPIVDVFSLQTHDFFWINAEHLEPYVYQPHLRDKLILPDAQRDLLDILTADTDLLTGDIVEGKSAGNIILSKGVPGVGKTLTAEIYAEVCGRPLYSVHAGNLGTTPREVSDQLRLVFQRAKRWNCALLLDEADVFVMTRGRDVVQNAIVAEFLRTMEYFDGLLFMTTNRGDDIDEAILSRCAAIIHYDPPGPSLLPAVWRVMSENFEANLDEKLIAELIAAFPDITPRDVKMLLRLTLRVSQARGEPLSLDLFRKNAMFRGINARG